MGTVTGYWGRDNYTLKLAGQASMNVTLPANTYPSGTLELNSISSGSSPACWQRTGTSQTKHIDLFLCDSAGNNRVSLGGFNLSSATSKAYHTFTVGSGAQALTGKALYIIATGDTDNIESYHKITFTLGTTVASYSISASSGTGGTLKCSHTSASPGTTVTLTPTAKTGYKFKNYTVTGGITISNNKFTMPSSDVSIVANFEKITYTITRKSSPAAAGTVITSAATATMGTTITISHEDNTGYEFWGYTSSPASLISGGSFTMPASNVTITGNWKRRSTCTLNKTTVTGGGSVKITINTEDSTYFHRYWLNFGTGMDSGWVDVPVGTTTVTFNIPTDWSAALPNTTSTTGWLRLRTYTDSTRTSMIASDYEISGLTYEVPASVVPTFDGNPSAAVLYTVGGTTFPSVGSGIYVQNHCGVTVGATAHGNQGATITSMFVKIGGYSGSDYQKTFSTSTISFNSGLLTTSGNLNLKITATDSRGRTATATTTIQIAAYSKPSGTLSVWRVNNNGTADPSGIYGKYELTRRYTAVGTGSDANKWTVTKMTVANKGNVSNLNMAGTGDLLPGNRVQLDGLREYDVTLEIKDKFETTTIKTTLPSCRYTIFVNPYGDQIAFMKAVTKSIPENKGSTFEIPDNCQVYVGDSTLESWVQAQAKTAANNLYGLQTSVNITATGSKTVTVSGLTANHVVDNVDFFTNSGLSTPADRILADFTWTTSANTLTLNVIKVYTSCYVRFHFTYKK